MTRRWIHDCGLYPNDRHVNGMSDWLPAQLMQLLATLSVVIDNDQSKLSIKLYLDA